MHVQRPDARFLCDDRHQFVQRRHLAPREDVGAPGGGRHGAGQPKALDQIVDVRHMVEVLAVAEDHESPAGDSAEQLEQTPVSWPVDAGRPRDDQLDAMRGGGLARPAARPRVSSPDRCRRGGGARPRWPAGARCRRGRPPCCSARPGARRLLPRPRRATRRLPRSPCDMWPRAGRPVDIAPRRCRRRPRPPRRPGGFLVREIAADDRNAGARQVRPARAGSRTNARTSSPATRVPGEVPPGEAGRAGDEDLHRSARTVTGEPASFSSPTLASARSTLVVTARDLTACGPRWQHELARRGHPEPVAPELAAEPGVRRSRDTARAGTQAVRDVRCRRLSAARLVAAGSTITRAVATRQASATHGRQSGACMTHAGSRPRQRHCDRKARGCASPIPNASGTARRGPRFGHASISADASTAVTRAPASASTSAAQPVPVPTSSTIPPPPLPAYSRSTEACVTASNSPIGPLKRARSTDWPSPDRHRRCSCSGPASGVRGPDSNDASGGRLRRHRPAQTQDRFAGFGPDTPCS